MGTQSKFYDRAATCQRLMALSANSETKETLREMRDLWIDFANKAGLKRNAAETAAGATTREENAVVLRGLEARRAARGKTSCSSAGVFRPAVREPEGEAHAD